MQVGNQWWEEPRSPVSRNRRHGVQSASSVSASLPPHNIKITKTSFCFNFTYGFQCACFSYRFSPFSLLFFLLSCGASLDLLWLQVWGVHTKFESNLEACLGRIQCLLVLGLFYWFCSACPIVAACRHRRIEEADRRSGRICFSHDEIDDDSFIILNTPTALVTYPCERGIHSRHYFI